MSINYVCKSGKVLKFRLETESSGWLNNLKFEDRDGYLYFFKEGIQIFPDPSVYQSVRRFQILVSNQSQVAA